LRQRIVNASVDLLGVPPDDVKDGDNWSAAMRLRDTARAVILRHCGEPDEGMISQVRKSRLEGL